MSIHKWLVHCNKNLHCATDSCNALVQKGLAQAGKLLKCPFVPLFTSENAREFGLRSAVARREQAEATAAAEIEATNPGYVERRVVRVRARIEAIDMLLERERDPMKIDRLASALERLSELERVLSNRPKPGNSKPQTKRSTPQVAYPATGSDT